MSPTDDQYRDTVTNIQEEAMNLPYTGLDIASLIIVGLILVALGVSLYLATRKEQLV